MDSKFEPVMSGQPAAVARPPVIDVPTVDTSRVLRNTYWLLALSLLPTIAGAFAGMQFNFIALFKAAPIMTPLLMFGVMMGSLFLVTRLRNSAAAVPALFGFTFIAGLMLTPILTVAAGLSNGGQLVALSGGLTAAVFFALATYATTTKRDFGFLGRFLFIGTILLLVGFLVSMFFPIPTLTITLSAIAVLLFSLWLLHDLSRIVTGGETNYVMATLALFLDIYNIFVNLLSLLMVFAGNRE
jgi:FtsH-binding integral membrane protein